MVVTTVLLTTCRGVLTGLYECYQSVTDHFERVCRGVLTGLYECYYSVTDLFERSSTDL